MHTPLAATTNRGFTLVELLVAFAVFAVASLMITASFLSVVDTSRQVEQQQQIFDEFRLVADSLQREMSFGHDFRQPTSCADSCIEFAVRTRDDVPRHMVAYRLVGGRIEKAVQRLGGDCYNLNPVTASDFAIVDACFSPISSENVTISELTFSIENDGSLTVKPIVSFAIRGEAQVSSGGATPLVYSTTVTPRDFQDPSATSALDNNPPDIFIEEYKRPSDVSWSPVTPLITIAGTEIQLRGRVSDSQSTIKDTMVWENNDLYSYLGPNTGSITLPGVDGIWTTGTIDLTPGVENRITIRAEDTQNNRGAASVKVESTAAPVPPPNIASGSTAATCHSTMPAVLAVYLSFRVAHSSPSDWQTWRAYVCSYGLTDPVCSGSTATNYQEVSPPPTRINQFWYDIYPYHHSFTGIGCNSGASTLCLDRTYCVRMYGYDPRTGLESTGYIEQCRIYDSTLHASCIASAGAAASTPRIEIVPNKTTIVNNTSVSTIVDASVSLSVIDTNYTPNNAVFSVASAPAGWNVTYVPSTLSQADFGTGAVLKVEIPGGVPEGTYEVEVSATAVESATGKSATDTESFTYILQVSQGGQT